MDDVKRKIEETILDRFNDLETMEYGSEEKKECMKDIETLTELKIQNDKVENDFLAEEHKTDVKSEELDQQKRSDKWRNIREIGVPILCGVLTLAGTVTSIVCKTKITGKVLKFEQSDAIFNTKSLNHWK